MTLLLFITNKLSLVQKSAWIKVIFQREKKLKDLWFLVITLLQHIPTEIEQNCET